MKPGYKTTEFWVTMATNIAGVLVALGVISPQSSSPLVEAVGKVAGGIILGLSTLGYGLSRGKAKGGGR